MDSSNDVTIADQLKHHGDNKACLTHEYTNVPCYFQINTFRLQANSKMWWYGSNWDNTDLLNV